MLLKYEESGPSCRTCSDLDPDSSYQEVSTSSLRDSSEQGCPRCKVLIKVLESIAPEADEKYSSQGYVHTMINDFSMGRKLILQVQWDGRRVSPSAINEAAESFHDLEISKVPAIPCLWPNVPEASAISGNTGSDVAVARVRKWLELCTTQHKNCTRAITNILPTRLLQINGPQEVRLHSTKNETDPYVCLSYCWGTTPFIRTTSSTQHQYQSNIPWSELPKTFQDAISFTYRLRIRYLWIDSLCIVQDSVEDWRYESGQMANIYKTAYLTLAATHSADASGGCFSTAHPEHVLRHWTLTESDLSTTEFYTRNPLSHEDFSMSELPLSRRGWAFQERMLSNRVVHFTKQELIWECLDNVTCECSQVQRDSVVPMPKVSFAQSLQEADRQWRTIVLLYTSTRLTFTKDIFPALQGLAKAVHPVLGSYLAGLWSNALIPNLAWRTIHMPLSPLVARPEEWRAPTWSWASTTTEIIWNDPIKKAYDSNPKTSNFVAVLDCIVVAKGDDTTGELVSGELKIKGRCIRGIVSYRADASSIWYGDHVSSTCHPGLALQSEGTDIDVKRQMICASYYISWDYAIKAPGLHHVADGSDVVVLKTEEVVDRYAATSHWLILRPAQGRPTVFERIGLLTLEVDHPRSEQPTDMAREIGGDYGEHTFEEEEIQMQLARNKEEDMKWQLNAAHKAALEMEFTVI